MAAITQQRVRARPAHPLGPTCLAYTPNGKNLITAGSNSVVRVYTTGSDGEPTNIDDCQENNLAIAATNDFFVTGSEDGRVCVYSLENFRFDMMITRCTLPIRDLAISPDDAWLAVASDEIEVKIVNISEMTRVLYLREHPKPTKHVSFNPSGSHIAVSCTDGIVYIYSLSTEEPELIRKVDGVIRSLETDVDISSKAVWHPDGRAFAAPTATRDIQVISWEDGERQRAFNGSRLGDVTSLAWSPNGALLLSAGSDGKILLWETKTQKTLAKYALERKKPMEIADGRIATIILTLPILHGIPTRTSFLLLLRMESFSSVPISYRLLTRNSSKRVCSQPLSSMTRFRRIQMAIKMQ